MTFQTPGLAGRFFCILLQDDSRPRLRDSRASGYTTNMLRFSLNGVQHELAETLSVSELLAEYGYAQRRVAVEINHEIVPKSEHAKRQLHDGDRVEVVHAIGGG